MDDRLTIGRFARLTGLSAKALRNYDASGLLRPADVDLATGYRRYDSAQVETGRLIRRLRDLDVPLEDVRAVLEDPGQLPKRLAARAAEVEADVFRHQRIAHRLRHFTDPEEAAVTAETDTFVAGGLTPEEERQVAVDLFNHTWELLETSDRTPAQDDRMLHAAHASRLHWERTGTPRNLAVGEWQCARVYAVLGRAEPTLHHARRCIAMCEEHDVGPFYLAEGYEALARGHAVAGDRAAAAEAEAQAWRVAEGIQDAEERQMLEQDLASVPR
ncbi:MAG TPA: helix-turn-helix domain-containing protein [Actinomycetota bacterium]|nr:helix-turn-helix domain-containing protein [Actinomycetota bacterium]